MRSTLVIAWREIEEKRFVLLAAVACALLPPVFGAIPWIGEISPRDAVVAGSLLLAIGFTLGLAAILGASIVGRDLSERRMSFYFSRPISATSIWAGKVLAALALVVGSFLIIVAPAAFFDRSLSKQLWNLPYIGAFPSFVIVLVAAALLLLVAHTVSTFVRSRSPLIALDFAAAVLCVIVVPYLFRPLLAGSAWKVALTFGKTLGCASVIVLLSAGAWQLAHGRADLKDNHSALSRFLWSSMALALVIGAAFVTWVVSAKPSDLNADVFAQRAPAGPWLALMGRASSRGDYRAGFLINSETGEFRRLDPFAFRSMQFSPDGRRAYYLKAGAPATERVGSAKGEADLYVLRFGDREPLSTRLVFKNEWQGYSDMMVPTARFFISADGARVATIEDGLLSIYDVARKQSIASVRVGFHDTRALFVSTDIVRLLMPLASVDNCAAQPWSPFIQEFDVRTKSLRTLGAVSDTEVYWGKRVRDIDSTGARMLSSDRSGDAVMVCDAKTGETIRTLAKAGIIWDMRFLRDGRIAILRGTLETSTLLLFSSDGLPMRELALGRGWHWCLRWYVVEDDGTHAVLAFARGSGGIPFCRSISIAGRSSTARISSGRSFNTISHHTSLCCGPGVERCGRSSISMRSSA